MGKKDNKAARIADALDMPLDTLCDLPRMEIMGNNEINIENLRGILDYDEYSFKINTRSGIIKIDGSNLVLSSVTDENVCLKGNIVKIEFI